MSQGTNLTNTTDFLLTAQSSAEMGTLIRRINESLIAVKAFPFKKTTVCKKELPLKISSCP